MTASTLTANWWTSILGGFSMPVTTQDPAAPDAGSGGFADLFSGMAAVEIQAPVTPRAPLAEGTGTTGDRLEDESLSIEVDPGADVMRPSRDLPIPPVPTTMAPLLRIQAVPREGSALTSPVDPGTPVGRDRLSVEVASSPLWGETATESVESSDPALRPTEGMGPDPTRAVVEPTIETVRTDASGIAALMDRSGSTSDVVAPHDALAGAAMDATATRAPTPGEVNPSPPSAPSPFAGSIPAAVGTATPSLTSLDPWAPSAIVDPAPVPIPDPSNVSVRDASAAAIQSGPGLSMPSSQPPFAKPRVAVMKAPAAAASVATPGSAAAFTVAPSSPGSAAPVPTDAYVTARPVDPLAVAAPASFGMPSTDVLLPMAGEIVARTRIQLDRRPGAAPRRALGRALDLGMRIATKARAGEMAPKPAFASGDLETIARPQASPSDPAVSPTAIEVQDLPMPARAAIAEPANLMTTEASGIGDAPAPAATTVDGQDAATQSTARTTSARDLGTAPTESVSPSTPAAGVQMMNPSDTSAVADLGARLRAAIVETLAQQAREELLASTREVWTASVTVEPASLGRVEIQVTRAAGGLELILVAAHHEAARALDSEMDDLLDDLVRREFEPARASVRTHDGQFQSDRNPARSGQEASDANSRARADEESEEDGPPDRRGRRGARDEKSPRRNQS